jgi:hypothetical protein
MGHRRFPILLSPATGESLVSWLDRYCSELSTSRKDLYEGVGLRPLGAKQSPDHTLRVSKDQANSISAATGYPSKDVPQLTLARYEGRALVFRGKREGVDLRFLWARGAGSRYCPVCLSEGQGVWKLAWRLSWSFACVRHKLLLSDDCLGCGLPARSRPSIRDVPVANLCGNAVPNGTRLSCRGDCSKSRQVHLPGGSSVLLTQQWLEETIDSQELSSDHVQRLLNDLELLAGRALRVMLAADLRRWNGIDHLPGLEFEADSVGKRRSLFYPGSVAAMANAVSFAATVLRSDDEAVYMQALRALLPDLAGMAVKEFPSSLVRRWGEPSPELQSKMLKALHTGIRPASALRYSTAGSSSVPPSMGQAEILQRARSVPQRFWPGWTNLLQTDLPVGPRMLQTSLSVAVLLPGYARSDFALQQEVLELPSKDNAFSYVWRRLQAPDRDRLMKTVLALATYLDSHPAPIDYSRRRRLSLDGLLTSAIWQDLNDHRCGDDPTTARLYLTHRVTGSIPEHTQRGGEGYYLLQNFIASTPTWVLDELDERASTFLAEAGVTEPLSWEPPKDLLRDTPYVQRKKVGGDPVLNALIERGLIERPLVRRVAERPVKPVGALLPGPDSLEAQLRRYLDRGESVESIAVALNRSKRMIMHHMSRLGLSQPSGRKIPLDKEGLHDRNVVQGLAAQAIAHETGWSKNTIRPLLRVSGFKT